MYTCRCVGNLKSSSGIQAELKISTRFGVKQGNSRRAQRIQCIKPAPAITPRVCCALANQKERRRLRLRNGGVESEDRVWTGPIVKKGRIGSIEGVVGIRKSGSPCQRVPIWTFISDSTDCTRGERYGCAICSIDPERKSSETPRVKPD